MSCLVLSNPRDAALHVCSFSLPDSSFESAMLLELMSREMLCSKPTEDEFLGVFEVINRKLDKELERAELTPEKYAEEKIELREAMETLNTYYGTGYSLPV